MAVPLARQDPLVIKLDSTKLHTILTEDITDLKKLFDQNGYELRLAGGAVRDLIMGVQPQDLDFATTATPEQMKKLFNGKRIQMVNQNAEEHGTITPRISDKKKIEITTLRKDEVRNGVYLKSQFTIDWKLDALRRDFTINSMFLGFDGSVYDYFYGYDDIKARKVQFVGDAKKCIQEDHLRILRYFRFYGKIAKDPNAHVPGVLEAIKNNGSGLANIPGERIWMELVKILEGRWVADMLRNILHCQLGPCIGLAHGASANGLMEFNSMWQRSSNLKPCAITILSSLVSSLDEANKLHQRLKFSTYNRDMLFFLVKNRSLKPLKNEPLKPYQNMVLNSSSKDTSEYVEELLKYIGDAELLSKFRSWKIRQSAV